MTRTELSKLSVSQTVNTPEKVNSDAEYRNEPLSVMSLRNPEWVNVSTDVIDRKEIAKYIDSLRAERDAWISRAEINGTRAFEIQEERDAIRADAEKLGSHAETLIAQVEELRAYKIAALKELMKFREALEFYATYSPRFHPDGFWEIHIAEAEGGEVRFGTRARLALKGEEK